MGYTTKFEGGLKFSRELTHKEWRELKELAEYNNDVYKRYTETPETIPESYNQWEPNEDGTELVWDGGEKFYDYIHWLRWINKHYLAPRGIIINGELRWEGEEMGDYGIITVVNSKVTYKKLQLKGIVECPNCSKRFIPQNV